MIVSRETMVACSGIIGDHGVVPANVRLGRLGEAVQQQRCQQAGDHGKDRHGDDQPPNGTMEMCVERLLRSLLLATTLLFHRRYGSGDDVDGGVRLYGVLRHVLAAAIAEALPLGQLASAL